MADPSSRRTGPSRTETVHSSLPSRPWVRSVLLAAIVLATGCSTKQSAFVWPGDAWPAASPEEQGIESAAFDTLVADMRRGEYGLIDAFMVIVNGIAIVDERFEQDYRAVAADYDTTNFQYNYDHPDWHPYLKGSKLHTLQSVTKSVTSAALGVAVDRGLIDGTRQFVKPFFKQYEPYPTNAWRDSTRLEDFLTMRSGIEWKTDVTYESGEHSTNFLEASDQWVPYVLSQPMDTIPGLVFEYNDGVSVLLGEIVRQATGTRLDRWAEENLFRPIGIKDYYWKTSPSGEVDSEGGLYLATEDLARIGYLFLRHGNWNGNQVISEKWIHESTRPLIPDVTPADDGFSFGYSYHWWIPSWDRNPLFTIHGNGYGGQFLFVVPEYDLVVVFNSWNLHERPRKSTMGAFIDVILQAVQKKG